ncbi:MAG: acetate kinase [Lachnospiraceae bacterium]|nr:acetate kinase [Lachnospiraceae bacterium]
MKVLVINCGSSSLKYKLFDMETESVLAAGQADRIGLDGTFIRKAPGERTEWEMPMPNHTEAFRAVLDALCNGEYAVIKSLDEIDAVGHRVGHGGEKFTEPTIVTDEVIKAIDECADLAPIHNPIHLRGILACQEVMPNIPSVAVFDTAFHQTMPPRAYLYAIPLKYYKEYGVRRYGFHGTSVRFVAPRLAKLAGLDINNSKLIVCHIGSGASITAVKDGKSIDTTMGMTPVEGLVMGTRSGDIDPGIIEFLCKKENMTVSEVNMLLNTDSGVKGLSDYSNDYRDLLDASEQGNQDAENALQVLVYRIAKYVGAYYMALGGVDAIAFCGGAGEGNIRLRKRIMESFAALGIKINEEANQIMEEELLLSAEDSKIPVWVVPTDEELMISRETASLVANK